MAENARTRLIKDIRDHAVALTGEPHDYARLFKMIGDARYVLIGEATHGTDEFYRMRAEITKQLIAYNGFSAVAVEGDWPDCYRINRYVRGDGAIPNASSALNEFTRFPSWMWRNEAVAEFIGWLRDYNERKSGSQGKAGFYGLDVYSLYASIQAVIGYLDKVDPDAADRARHFYGCFDHGHTLAQDPQEYGYATLVGISPACERQAVEQLVELRKRAHLYKERGGFDAQEDYFSAEQNARTVLDAEQYYREMFRGRASSWNLRDKHMADTLYALAEHLTRQRGERARLVVWAHNSHIGDARATEMGTKGEWNIGQLVREAHGSDSVLIGFSTYSGSVTAASAWDGIAEHKSVLPAIRESYEEIFHSTGLHDFLLILRDNEGLAQHLDISRLQRAIGVLYLPETERQSHYFYSRLPQQFDAVIHLDATSALKPLEPSALWHKGEMFETYPSGM